VVGIVGIRVVIESTSVRNGVEMSDNAPRGLPPNV
jgi:hypothetical protein